MNAYVQLLMEMREYLLLDVMVYYHVVNCRTVFVATYKKERK